MKTPAEQLAIAIEIAVREHSGQFDKAGLPYILHPMKVMHYVRSTDLEVMAIAVLHDVIEDTRSGLTFQDLLDAGLSPRIVNAVRLLTKQPGQSLEEYILGILTNRDAIIVKMADLRHNSDIRRLKNKVITEKDIDRTHKYHAMYLRLTVALMDMDGAADDSTDDLMN